MLYRRACSSEAVASIDPLGVKTMLSVCLAARQVSQNSELRTGSILLHQGVLLQVESAVGSLSHRDVGGRAGSCVPVLPVVRPRGSRRAVWPLRRRPISAARQTPRAGLESPGPGGSREGDETPATWPAGIHGSRPCRPPGGVHPPGDKPSR